MNIEAELAAVDRKVRRLIEQRADEALIRLGLDPVAERRAEYLRAVGEECAKAMSGFAKMIAEAVEPIAAFAAAFAEGAGR